MGATQLQGRIWKAVNHEPSGPVDGENNLPSGGPYRREDHRADRLTSRFWRETIYSLTLIHFTGLFRAAQ